MSDLEDLIRLAVGRGANDHEIARVTGYSSFYVGSIRRKLGLKSTRPNVADQGRIRLIIERLQAGETLQEIGDALGVTRERIRQIAVKGGTAGKTGLLKRKELRAKTDEERRADFLDQREKRYQGAYGCSYAEVLVLNDGLPFTHPESRTLGYRYWVRNVLVVMRSSGTLNFPQWCAVWGDRWKERGRGTAYRLSRIDRTKAFTIDNVICERGDEGTSRQRKLNPWSGSRASASIS